MLNYLVSHFMPLRTKEHGNIVVIIRGMRFEAETWDDVVRKIDERISFYRQELSTDLNNVGYSLPGGGLNGKWDPNQVILGRDIKNLLALENYIKKNKG